MQWQEMYHEQLKAEMEKRVDPEPEYDRYRLSPAQFRGFLWLIRLTLLGLVVTLWGWVAPRHWQCAEDSHLHFLDTWGLGAVVWGAILLALIPQVEVGLPHRDVSGEHSGDDDRRLAELGEGMTPKKYNSLSEAVKVPDSVHGLSDQDLECVFSLSGNRLAKFIILLGKVAVNLASVSYNFARLPKREPDVPLNQAKHIVTWIEFPIIILALLYFLLFRGRSTIRGASALSFLSRFSVLQTLPEASPMRMLGRFGRLMGDYGPLMALGLSAIHLLMVPAAVMSVLLKIAQVSFVTEKMYWDWSWGNYLQVAGFMNNLAGLGPNEANLHSVLKFLNMKNPLLPQQWYTELHHRLIQHYPWPLGLMMSCTVTVEDVYKLLNENNRDLDGPPRLKSREVRFSRSSGTTSYSSVSIDSEAESAESEEAC